MPTKINSELPSLPKDFSGVSTEEEIKDIQNAVVNTEEISEQKEDTMPLPAEESLTIQDVLEAHETRLQRLEAAYFRLTGGL